MTAVIALVRPPETAPPTEHAPCAQCPAFELTFCRAVARKGASRNRLPGVDQFVHRVAPRRIICREQDELAAVPIICTGWALSAVMLADGSRQILSFLLPGDLVSPCLMFSARPSCFVEAITSVTYRAFNRADLRQLIAADPSTLDAMARVWTQEKRRTDELIVDLGRRSAAERIARLILDLVERLQERDLTSGPFEIDFPLRQHHIADATGLTPVHVSKLLSEFRRKGLIRVSDRSLKILDPAGFRAAANMR
jgi:CRP/FNR family transcriptional regulator, anaerobic regulatory protein